jgi:hypothetical protein
MNNLSMSRHMSAMISPLFSVFAKCRLSDAEVGARVEGAEVEAADVDDDTCTTFAGGGVGINGGMLGGLP